MLRVTGGVDTLPLGAIARVDVSQGLTRNRRSTRLLGMVAGLWIGIGFGYAAGHGSDDGEFAIAGGGILGMMLAIPLSSIGKREIWNTVWAAPPDSR